MKKIVTIILALALVAALGVGMFACKDPNTNNSGNNGGDDTPITQVLVMPNDANEIPAVSTEGTVDYSGIKVGMIFLHGDYSSYDANFINAANEAKTKLGLADNQIIQMIDIDESEDCTTAA